ncbi:serine/threonine-protein kinase/endoribonuclease IRE2-like [Babylonia areolata]|uniref:serine/threonine-protein kinase/endoribonuclease IRE2-like n=1 Tax=Babylonia areolata TaxID=304850 RepID=UPI003FCF373B
MELCDYTLDEYVGIVRLDHRQDPLSANRLAWQLLKGLKYLHSNFAVPHGNLMPGWIFVDCDGRLRLAGYGLRDVTATTRTGAKDHGERSCIEGDSRYWRATEHVSGSSGEPCFQADIQVAGMLLHYILTGGRHPYGDTGPEVEANLSHNNGLRQQRVSQEADHLVSIMTLSDPAARPSIDVCLKHPFFWSGEKRFRLVLIVGSDILTEMKTGIPLTGAGSASMVDILNVVHISTVSENWVGEVDPVLVKEMRAFRQYKNNLPELVLFVYNCCLHYDKMSTVAKEVLDDPCKYFQGRFPGLFMAVYRAMRASDRTDRTCYKPFF